MEPKPLKLPPSVIGQPEVLRVTRELEALNDFFVGADARKGGTPIQPPRLSRILDQLAKQNAYNLLESAHRAQLLSSLEELPKKAPILHISFASEPPPKVMETILIWMRQNIHPQTLLTVGLQPSIAAGFVLRTPNKWFDMSMREYLRKQVPNLAKLIAGAVDGK